MRVSDPITYLAALMALRITGKYTIQPAGRTEKPGTLVVYMVDGEIKRITGTYKESLDILLDWGTVIISKGRLTEKEIEKLKSSPPVQFRGLLKAVYERLESLKDRSTSSIMAFSTIKSILKKLTPHLQISSQSGKTLYDVLEHIERKPAIVLISMENEHLIGFMDEQEAVFINIIGKLEKEDVQKKTLMKDAKYWIFHPEENLYHILKGFAMEGVIVNGKVLIRNNKELKSIIEGFTIVSFFDANKRSDIKEPLVICIEQRCTGDVEGLMEKEVEYVAWA